MLITIKVYWNHEQSFHQVSAVCKHSFPVISSNTQQNHLSMYISQWLWCWRLTCVYPWFLTLWVVETDSLFITCYNSVQNTSPFLFSKFHRWFFVFQYLFTSIHFPSFLIFSNCVDFPKWWATFNALAHCFNVCVESSSNNACKSASSIFWLIWTLLAFYIKITTFKRFKP